MISNSIINMILNLFFDEDESFRIQCTNSMKDIYILKKINEIRLERTYSNNRLKWFKIKTIENLSTR